MPPTDKTSPRTAEFRTRAASSSSSRVMAFSDSYWCVSCWRSKNVRTPSEGTFSVIGILSIHQCRGKAMMESSGASPAQWSVCEIDWSGWSDRSGPTSGEVSAAINSTLSSTHHEDLPYGRSQCLRCPSGTCLEPRTVDPWYARTHHVACCVTDYRIRAHPNFGSRTLSAFDSPSKASMCLRLNSRSDHRPESIANYAVPSSLLPSPVVVGGPERTWAAES